MSFINKVYIPFIEDFHDENKFLFYEKYYNQIGFDVKKIILIKEEDINYPNLIKKMSEEDEEVFIFIDYVILPPFSIHQAIDLSIKNECTVIPMTKMYLINDEQQIQNAIDSFVNNTILENFYYSSNNKFKVWPLEGCWVIHKNSLDEHSIGNNNIESPSSYDFDFCYKQYIFKNLIFIESDGYKFLFNFATIDSSVLFVYKEYLEAMVNLFGFPKEIYLYKNQVLEKIDSEKCKEVIFSLERYFSYGKYV
jgi:hypothetical protein